MSSVANSPEVLDASEKGNGAVSGEFMDYAGDRWYAIHNVDRMDPFFISVISDVDHWLFVSSTGGLTAGRVSPATSLFPYITVDRIHDSAPHTGCKTILRVQTESEPQLWEPFNREHDDRYSVSRNLYKSLLGDKLCFEEINHDLQLSFTYTWMTSDEFGFIRRCHLENLGSEAVVVDMLDGLQNILPAGTPLFAQSNTSNLVDAYKWTELDESNGLALYSLYSGITDRAEPCESLKATTIFCMGLEDHKVLISSEQLKRFQLGGDVESESNRRGIRGAYFVNKSLELAPGASQRWQIVANLEQSQSDVVRLAHQLRSRDALSNALSASVSAGSSALGRIMASGDGYQATAEENVTVHHYANVLFNILRGGVFDDQYNVNTKDFSETVQNFNKAVFKRNQKLLDELPEKVNFSDLLAMTKDDPQLARLAYEYLPITFGRRHGDPSRPWNEFSIDVKNQDGDGLLSYQGNWRDIFQNWEALLFSYPGYAENVIAKFVNASTMDGYNPYRITKEGIDWEVEEPDDPWSYIGYWGDHQIIYLLKLLEISRDFHPKRLTRLLREPIFCYANVPYRIADFESILEHPKDTVRFDEALADTIDERVGRMGADGKLLLDEECEVYQVNLLEKLLVPLLAKLGNLVVDGGIWLNTQRPEWNDANNALVGHGLSMVTLYYLRRYVRFLQDLLATESGTFGLSREVGVWLADTARALKNVRPFLGHGKIDASERQSSMVELGQAASRYRETVYQQDRLSGVQDQSTDEIVTLLDDALAVIDHSISTNRRDDGLYHAYNLLDARDSEVNVETLYPMLEGQVAALSAGSISPKEAVEVLEALFDSSIYRPGQKSFMLYPDRPLPKFLAKNRITDDQFAAIPLLGRMTAAADGRIVIQDADGCYRFNADFKNAGDLKVQLQLAEPDYGDEVEAARRPLLDLYESVFQHKAFTGRSGTMFSFEGLGSIYWHMVAKLLLAVLENYYSALDQQTDPGVLKQLGQLYYRVREGIGFNKTPAEYGAFPTDPYSHTPKHSGARQPGMTGQVKEEILCRFGELGVRVRNGVAYFQPALLRGQEFLSKSRETGYLDVDDNWQTVSVPVRGLAFTWCQVPIIYKLDDDNGPGVTISRADGQGTKRPELTLTAEESSEVFERNGRIRQITVTFPTNSLFVE